MDKVQNKPYSSVQHTPSSESFKENFSVGTAEVSKGAVSVKVRIWS
jgi:hypothetical protein